MAKHIRTVRCPLCGWHHPISRTGIMRVQRGELASQPKGDFSFDKGDPAEMTLISIRECRGKGHGLPEVERISLKDIMSLPEYQELITSLKNQAYKILEILVK